VAADTLDVVVAGYLAGHLRGGPDRRVSQVVFGLGRDVLKGGGAPATRLLRHPAALGDLVAGSCGLTSDASLATLLALTLATLRGGPRVRDARVVDVIDEVMAAEARAREVLRARLPALLRLAEVLDRHGELTGREVEGLLGGP
jgi:hypothetical protein